MPLAIDYDPEVDVLRITTEQRPWVGWHLEDDMNLVVKVGENHDRDVIGLLLIGGSGYTEPYFRVKDSPEPVWAGRGAATRYDPEADTLTWGISHDDPERITQAYPVVVYWGFPELEDDDDVPLIPALGAALLNAAKHLSPWFVPVEPPAAG